MSVNQQQSLQIAYVKRFRFYKLYQFSSKIRHYLWQIPRVSKQIRLVVEKLTSAQR
jgi:hypothetical protein